MSKLLLLLSFLVILVTQSCSGDKVVFGMVREIGTVLGDIDQSLLDGFNVWKYWIEQHSGLNIGGENLTIEMITEIAAEGIPDDTPNEIRQPLTQNATRRLLERGDIDVVFGPFGTIRTLWVMEEKKNLVGDAIPFMVSGGGGASIFTQGHLNLWANSAGTQSAISNILDTAIEAASLFDDTMVQTFSLLGKQDGAFYESSYYAIQQQLVNKTSASLLYSALYPSSLQTDDLAQAQQLMQPLKDADAQVTLLSGGIVQDIQTLLALFRSYQYTPPLFAVLSPVDDIALDYWDIISPEGVVQSTFFHPDEGNGVPDKYLGLSSDYPITYEQLFGKKFTNLRTAQASASCVAWQLGAERAGSNWRNATHFISGMRSLQQNDTSTETFLGRWQFTPTGQNLAKHALFIQFQKGSDGIVAPVLIKSASDLIYPAPWPWGEDDTTDDIDTAKTIGIVVGSFAGFLVLLAIVGAAGALLFIVLKKKYFHLICLKKGAEVKEVGL